LSIELLPHQAQTRFNLKRWEELQDDPFEKVQLCAAFPKKVELP
jgi:hypothetical protein